MGTRCLIGIENKDKTVDYVYCGHDGYPSGVGLTLSKHYNEEKLRDLITHGWMSSLDKDISECDFYGDECGDGDIGIERTINREEYIKYHQNRDTEYAYLYVCDEEDYYVAEYDNDFTRLDFFMMYEEDFLTRKNMEGKIADIARVIERYGWIDGAHHKDWVLTRVLKIIYGDYYDKWLEHFCDGEDGPDTYSWEEGCPP